MLALMAGQNVAANLPFGTGDRLCGSKSRRPDRTITSGLPFLHTEVGELAFKRLKVQLSIFSLPLPAFVPKALALEQTPKVMSPQPTTSRPSLLTEDNCRIGSRCAHCRNGGSGECDQAQQNGRADKRDGIQRLHTEQQRR